MRAVSGSLVLLCTLGACDEAPSPPSDQGNIEAKAEAKSDAKSGGPIGAFSKYKARSMSSEALVNVSRIADGVQSAFVEERVEPGSLSPVSGTLPPSTPMTPAAGACCKQPEGTCAPDMGDWTHEGWTMVNFAPTDPHRYSYEIITKDQTVTVRAQGDLDCDGTLSTYEKVGTPVDGILEFSELQKTDPLE